MQSTETLTTRPPTESLPLAIHALTHDGAEVLIGILAGHFVDHDALDAATLRRFVTEAGAVGK